MQQPLASVIMPAYNAERFLREAMESALAQTWSHVEVVLVDDGSTDGTRELAQEFARRDARVRVFTQENSGVGAARNRGIAEARGEYIAPLDADDIWFPDKLARQIRTLESKGERWGMAYCWSKSINEAGEVTEPLSHWPVEGNIFESLIYRNVIGNASVPVFRASVLRETGLYRTRAEQGGAQGCEDWDLTIRVAAKSLAAEVPEYLVGYRQVPGTMSSNFDRMAASYEYSISDLRKNHPELPKSLLRWSAGHFYMYLLNTCYAAGNYAECIRLLRQLIAADPAMIFSPTIYRIAFMCGCRSIFGRNFLQRNNATRNAEGWNPGQMAWIPAHWIEAKRWAAIQARQRSQ